MANILKYIESIISPTHTAHRHSYNWIKCAAQLTTPAKNIQKRSSLINFKITRLKKIKPRDEQPAWIEFHLVKFRPRGLRRTSE